MTYIELINNFWRLNKEYSFTPNEKVVYFALLNKANELAWKNPFNQSNAYLALDSGISEPAMIKARNTLRQKGLINFKSEVGRRHITKYEIKYLKSLSISDSISHSISRSISRSISDSFSDEKCLDNIRLEEKKKTRLDKTDNPQTPAAGGGALEGFPVRENLFSDFILKFNKIKKSRFTAKDKKAERQYFARRKEGYTDENMLDALKTAMKDKFHIDNAFKYLTPEFITRSDKIERYLNQQPESSGGGMANKLLEHLKNK
jgi:hypothetical protein